MAKWSIPFLKRRQEPEFKPDASGSSFRKVLHMTQQQRLTYLRWGLYIAVCLLALIVQDTIMSRVSILGATTDLAPAALLLIAVIENSEVGSLFALFASIFYFFSGSAPLAYCVGLITVFGMAASLFRQKYWHRSAGSVVLSAGVAGLAYEIGLWGVGVFFGLTRWDRVGIFFLTGLYNAAVMIPMYFLLAKIGTIGGNQWKE